MNINLILDAAAQAAPAPIQAAWTTAANMIDAAFATLTDNITVNINMHYTGTGGGASGGPDDGAYESYQSVFNYLRSSNSYYVGDTTFASLPNATTIGGASQVEVWNAQLKLMGLISPNDTTTDDASATFATDIDPSLMVGVALREFTQAMGRVPFGDASGNPDTFDFFRYTAPGTRLFAGGTTAPPAYFSLNGGLTKWFDYGQTSDPSDFLNAPASPLSPEDPFNEFYDGGTLQYLTPADIEQMDALGYPPTNNVPAVDGHDFNGDNSADILLQNAGGQIVYANMLGGVFQGFVNVVSAPGYNVVGAGKFSGLSSDVVLQNAQDQIVYAELVNGNFSNLVSVGAVAGQVIGVGNFNEGRGYLPHLAMEFGNPPPDLTYYVVDHGYAPLGYTPGFTAKAVADINGDGNGDIVIQDASGVIDYISGHFRYAGVASTPGFNVVGAGDINRDGFADIVIQNPTTGEIDYANMNNGVFSGFVGVGRTPGWNVTAVEDVIGNGFDDIVIQNPMTGQIDYINMTTGTFQGFVAVADVPGYTGYTDPATPDGGAPTPLGALDRSIYAGATLGPQTVYDNTLNANDTAAGALGAPTDPHWMPLVGV